MSRNKAKRPRFSTPPPPAHSSDDSDSGSESSSSSSSSPQPHSPVGSHKRKTPSRSAPARPNPKSAMKSSRSSRKDSHRSRRATSENHAARDTTHAVDLLSVFDSKMIEQFLQLIQKNEGEQVQVSKEKEVSMDMVVDELDLQWVDEVDAFAENREVSRNNLDQICYKMQEMFTQAEHQSAGNMDKVFTTVKTSLDAAMGTLKTKDFKKEYARWAEAERVFRQENNKAWRTFIEADKIRQAQMMDLAGVLTQARATRVRMIKAAQSELEELLARQAQEVSELDAEQAECQKLYRAKMEKATSEESRRKAINAAFAKVFNSFS